MIGILYKESPFGEKVVSCVIAIKHKIQTMFAVKSVFIFTKLVAFFVIMYYTIFVLS